MSDRAENLDDSLVDADGEESARESVRRLLFDPVPAVDAEHQAAMLARTLDESTLAPPDDLVPGAELFGAVPADSDASAPDADPAWAHHDSPWTHHDFPLTSHDPVLPSHDPSPAADTELDWGSTEHHPHPDWFDAHDPGGFA